MTKQELLEAIQALPDDIVFVLSSDEEGNSYREAHLDDTISKAYPEGYGYEVLHPDDLEEYGPDELPELIDVVVFW